MTDTLTTYVPTDPRNAKPTALPRAATANVVLAYDSKTLAYSAPPSASQTLEPPRTTPVAQEPLPIGEARVFKSKDCHFCQYSSHYLRQMLYRFQTKIRVGDAMKRTFKPLIGHPVVLELALGQIKLYVSGTILKDCGKTLVMKPETGPDVEIPRDYIMNIETPNRWIQPSIKFL